MTSGTNNFEQMLRQRYLYLENINQISDINQEVEEQIFYMSSFKNNLNDDI